MWTRALDGRDLFLDVDDRRDVVARLSAVLPDGGARCFGWALMSNHVHLVVKTGDRSLGRLMQRVFTGYAMRFNGRSGRRGYLLQGRFGSRPVRDEADLEAGLARGVDALEQYPWSSLGALMGRRPPLPFESVSETLALFDADEAIARSRLRVWIERPEPRAPGAGSTLDVLVRSVCAELAVAEADLRGGSRSRLASRARALVCRRAVGGLGLGVVDVARALGLTHGAVSQAVTPPSAQVTEKERPFVTSPA